ncbi:hypothetical protein NIES2111_66390 (plasmid) [Nostoc sp. NIES-2111]|nr:hypothetical protein NIES2111_66390 [Nostoc sp. NIES-2111]
MKRLLALASVVVLLSMSTTALVAGSIVINNQPALAEHEDQGER